MTSGGQGVDPPSASRPSEVAHSPRIPTRTRRSPAVRAVGTTVAAAAAGTVVLAALAVGLGLLLTRELLHGTLGRWDADVTAWLVARRTPARDDLSAWGSDLAGTLVVPLVVGAALVLLAWRRRWQELAIVACAIAVEGATYAISTFLVTRHRPRVPRLEDLIVADSYFSGHTAAAVAVYGSLAIVVWRCTRTRGARAAVLVVAVGFPVAVALSRMYRGMHFASDAVVGGLVGLACLVVAVLAARAGAHAAARVDIGAGAARRERVAERSPRSAVGFAP